MPHPTRIRLAGVLLAALGGTGSAHAFYWDGWPGNGISPPRTLVPNPIADGPKLPPNPNADPKFPPNNEPPGPTPGGPSGVPEPTSALAVLTGLGVLAARRLRRS